MSSSHRSSGSASRLALAGALLAAAAAGPASLGAQRSGEGPAFVVRRAGDTIVVERTRRTADSLTGEVVLRRGGVASGARIEHAASLGPAGTVTGIDVRVVQSGSGVAGARRASVRFRTAADGAAVAELRQGDDTTTRELPTEPGAIPVLDASIAHLELVVRRARAIGGDSVDVPIFLLDGGRTVRSRVIRQGRDAVVLVTGNNRVTLRLGPAGDIVSGGDPARQLAISRLGRTPARRTGAR